MYYIALIIVFHLHQIYELFIIINSFLLIIIEVVLTIYIVF